MSYTRIECITTWHHYIGLCGVVEIGLHAVDSNAWLTCRLPICFISLLYYGGIIGKVVIVIDKVIYNIINILYNF